VSFVDTSGRGGTARDHERGRQSGGGLLRCGEPIDRRLGLHPVHFGRHRIGVIWVEVDDPSNSLPCRICFDEGDHLNVEVIAVVDRDERGREGVTPLLDQLINLESRLAVADRPDGLDELLSVVPGERAERGAPSSSVLVHEVVRHRDQ
jgi:hypothetical protein